MPTLLVHGAGASPLSFTTIRSKIEDTAAFSYDVNRPFNDIVVDCIHAARVHKADRIVGHSFGGLVAWHAACAIPFEKGVSIASPWKGNWFSDVTEAMCLGIYPTHFLKNTSAKAKHAIVPRHKPAPCQWLNVIATRPGIFPWPPNDGVVTVESQEALCLGNSALRRIHHSHTEVLHSEELVAVLREFL
jgi:pimeloyl-ACP methyl ester carboxylesterase